MAHLGLAALEFARTGLLEALCGAAVCLQLWHCVPNEVLLLYNPLSIYDRERVSVYRLVYGYRSSKYSLPGSTPLLHFGAKIFYPNELNPKIFDLQDLCHFPEKAPEFPRAFLSPYSV